MIKSQDIGERGGVIKYVPPSMEEVKLNIQHDNIDYSCGFKSFRIWTRRPSNLIQCKVVETLML